MDDAAAAGYLSRIGADRPDRPDLAGLRTLMARHLVTVPFENLSLHLDEPVSLAEPDLLDKIVARRRGGFCYELNGAFAALLRHLGYQVTLLAGRVYGEDGEHVGPLFDHLTLRVDLDGEPWLADVGFGRFVAAPFRLVLDTDQQDAAGTVRVTENDEGDLEIALDGRPQLRVEQRPRRLDDFAPMCWYQQTSPSSHFRQSLVCSRPTGTGRVTISDRLLVTTEGDRRTETQLGSDADVLAAYREHFGFELDRLPTPPQPTG